MPMPFQCHWCDKPTMKIEGICIQCEQRYEEGNKDIAKTIRELETRVSWLEKGLKLVIKIANDRESGLVMAAQAILDGEPTTADEHNEYFTPKEIVYISDVNKEIAKEWKNDTMQEDEKLVFEEQFEEGGKFAGVDLKDREREEKIKKKANMIQSIGYRGEDE
jgi:hypothetical protein